MTLRPLAWRSHQPACLWGEAWPQAGREELPLLLSAGINAEKRHRVCPARASNPALLPARGRPAQWDGGAGSGVGCRREEGKGAEKGAGMCSAMLGYETLPPAARHDEEITLTSPGISRAILRSHSPSNNGQVHFAKLQETPLALSCTTDLLSLFPLFYRTRSNRENCYSRAGCVQSLIRYPV